MVEGIFLLKRRMAGNRSAIPPHRTSLKCTQLYGKIHMVEGIFLLKRRRLVMPIRLILSMREAKN